MIVKCIHNNYNDLELPKYLGIYLNKIHGGNLDRKLSIEMDEIYVCYAMSFGPYGEWVFIDNGKGSRYPDRYPSILFSYVDKTVSRYWAVGEYVDYKNNRSPFLAIEEWASNKYFHGLMFEGDQDALQIFEFYKKLMDVEFPRPDITQMPEKLGEPYWVFDSDTEDWWQVNPFDALTRVPKTYKFINNPYYKHPKTWIKN